MAAVSGLKDFTADRCIGDILHSIFNMRINYKTLIWKENPPVNKPPSIHFSNCSKLFCNIHFEENMFLSKHFFI